MSEPRLILPAPWGAGVFFGIARIMPQPEPTAYRGPVQVIQSESVEFRHGLRCLSQLAKSRGLSLPDYPWAMFSAREYLGRANLVDCRDLSDSRSGLRFADHMNGGQNPPHRWAWIFEPMPADATTAAAQPVLFAGL